MNGHVVLSHGMNSSPLASKVSAMAAVAQRLGFRTTLPDYRDLDATQDVAYIPNRLLRLKEQAGGKERLILAGSSMGAFISGLVSLELPCAGLFLMALPLTIPGFAQSFDAAPIPTTVVHGWDDELIPVSNVIAFARKRHANLVLLPDTHRLSNHVDFIATQFELFLTRFLLASS